MENHIKTDSGKDCERYRKPRSSRSKVPVEKSDAQLNFVRAQRALYKEKAQTKRAYKQALFAKKDTEFDQFCAVQQCGDIGTHASREEERQWWWTPEREHLYSVYSIRMAKRNPLWLSQTQCERKLYFFLQCRTTGLEEYLHQKYVVQNKNPDTEPISAIQQGLGDYLPNPVAGITSQLSRANDTFERLTRAADKLADTTVETVEGVRDFFSENKSKLAAQVALALASLYVSPKVSTVILEILKILVQYTSVFDDIPSYFAKVWPTINKMIQWTLRKTGLQGSIDAGPAVARQAIQEDKDLSDFVPTSQFWMTAGALAAGVGAMFGASLIAENKFDISKTATKAFHRAAENSMVKRIQDGIEGFVEVVIDKIKESMISMFPEGTFMDFMEDWLRSKEIDPTTFVSEVNAITNPLRRDQIINNKSSKQKLQKLVDQAHEIESGIADKSLKLDSKVVTLLRDSIRKLMSFVTFFLNAHQEEIRDTPFCISYFSEPGVGKSVLTRCIAVNLTHPEHGCTVEVDHENLIYTRSSCDKFYTNYRGQSIFIVDDWGQARSSSPDNSEMRDFIAIISAMPFSPPQASIEDKGRPFCSKLYINTTNVPYPKPTEISEHTAIYRRRNYMWEMVVANRSLPLEDPNRYGFYKHSPYEQGRISGMLSFEDHILEMIPVFNAWDQKNQTIKQIGVVPFSKKAYVPQKLGGEPGQKFALAPSSDPPMQAVQQSHDPAYHRQVRNFAEMQETFERNLKRSVAHRQHVWERAKREVGLGFQEESDFNFCMCCGGQSCTQTSFETFVCGDDVPNYYNAWNYLESINKWCFEKQAGYRYSYCLSSSTLYNYRIDDPKERYSYSLRNRAVWMENTKEWEHNVPFLFFWKLWAHDEQWQTPAWDDSDWAEGDTCGSRMHFQDWLGRLSLDEVDYPQAIPALEQGEHLVVDLSAEQEEAQILVAEAKDGDEKQTLTKILENTAYPNAYKWAIKAVVGMGIVYLGIKAVGAIQRFFGPKQEVKLSNFETKADGSITAIVEELPLSMRGVATKILQNVVTELAASAATRVFTMEGGASAYGEAKTIRAVQRANMKFARPLQELVKKQVLAEAPAPFMEGEDSAFSALEQGCTDSNGLDLVTSVLGPKTCFTLTREKTEEEGGGFREIKGFGLKGRLVAFPWHFMPKVPTVLESTLRMANRVIPLSIDYRKARQCMNGAEKMDLALIELDYGVESFVDITKHFARESQLKSLTRFKSMMVKHQSKAGGYFITSDYINTTSVTKDEFTYGPSYEEQNVRLLEGFKYNLPTQAGDCGALLVALNPALQGRICGFHVAGISHNELGLSSAITYEVLSQNITKYFPKLVFGTTATPTQEQVSVEEKDVDKATVYCSGEMEFCGVLSPQYRQRMPTKHDIVPSRLHDKVYKHTKEPSILSPSDPRIDRDLAPQDYVSPLDQGLRKYSEHPKPFPSDLVEQACGLIYKEMAPYAPSGMDFRLLDDIETINGNQFAQYTGVDMSTSPGMPYKNIRPHGSKGKHIFYTYDEETQLYRLNFDANVQGICPARVLQSDMEAWENAARNNEDVPLHMNYENLKQETMAIKNIKIGKTRLFSCAPLAINLLFRKYFGAFIATANQNCTQLPSSVGINPLGADWTFLAKRLLEKGDFHIAGDYKLWDGKLMGAVMQKFVELVVNRLYRKHGGTEADDRVRMRLIDYAIHTYTIVGNTLILKHQGNPSGIPITSDLNSGCNWVYMIVAFTRLWEQHRKDTPSCQNCAQLRPVDFHKHVAAAFYGDDHDLSVGPEARCFFTFNSIRDFFGSHGITYTDALKRGGVVPDFQPLKEVSYLKRGFVLDDGMYLAPLELDSIRDQLNWVKKNNDPNAAMLQNVESAMREFFMHGEQCYNEADRVITDALEELQDMDLAHGEESFVVPSFSFEQERRKWRDGSF
jgi:hypothetical protein